MKRTALFVLLTAFLASCGEEWKPPAKEPVKRGGRDIVNADGAPSLGSEHNASRKQTYGTSTVLRDTYLLPRQTDYKNFARVHFGDPSQGDLDTWEARKKEGRVIEIPAGTKVTRMKSVIFRMSNGTEAKFVSVEVADRSLMDDDGFPRRGNIYHEYLSPPGR